MSQSKLTPAEELDLLSLDQLIADLDEEMAKEILSCFLNDTQDVIDRLETNLNANDTEAVRKTAHMLVGCCRSVNAAAAERLGKKIEHLAADGDLTSAKNSLAELKEVFRATTTLALRFVEVGDTKV